MKTRFSSIDPIKRLWRSHRGTAMSLKCFHTSCTLFQWMILTKVCLLLFKYRRNVTTPQGYLMNCHCVYLQTRHHYTFPRHQLLSSKFLPSGVANTWHCTSRSWLSHTGPIVCITLVLHALLQLREKASSSFITVCYNGSDLWSKYHHTVCHLQVESVVQMSRPKTQCKSLSSRNMMRWKVVMKNSAFSCIANVHCLASTTLLKMFSWVAAIVIIFVTRTYINVLRA